MLKTRIIPCMLYNGSFIFKTIQFMHPRTLGNPIQFARVYNNRNVDELIFLDATATHEKREPLFDVISDIAQECFMPLTVGGGIRNMNHVDTLFKIGADKVSVNTEAVRNPKFIEVIAKKYGSQSIVLAMDVKLINNEYWVFIERGKKNTGKKATDWAMMAEKLGAGELFINSINHDGMMDGYDCNLIQKISRCVTIPIIACGGAGKVQDIVDAVKIGGANAVSLASMFHYSGHTSSSIKERMAKNGIAVRIIK